jgi:diguanylate cyclase (GGDEF)-like protein
VSGGRSEPNNGMQRSADTRAVIFRLGAARPLMPGVRPLIRSIVAYQMSKDLSPEDYDSLTGLYSRRYAFGAFERLLAAARQTHDPIGVILADVDRMRNYNEAYGLSCGDELIRLIGSALKAAVGRGGLACRYSGDEFLIILPGFPLGAAVAKAEEVRQAVGRVTYPDVIERDEPNYRGMTLGVAAFPDNGLDLKAVVSAADMALYLGQRAGRGRVTTA